MMNRYLPQPSLTRTVTRKLAVELENRQNEFVLRAAIPGVEAKDLDVRVARRAVAISGEDRNEQQVETHRVLHSEFRYGKLERVIQLPIAIDNSAVRADFSNGILTLTLPKASAVRNQAVKVELTPAVAATQPQLPETELPEPVAESPSQPVNDETGDVWAT